MRGRWMMWAVVSDCAACTAISSVADVAKITQAAGQGVGRQTGRLRTWLPEPFGDQGLDGVQKTSRGH